MSPLRRLRDCRPARQHRTAQQPRHHL